MTEQQITEGQLKILEIIVLAQLMTEALETLQGFKVYNKQALKMRINQLLPELIKIAEKDYNAIFGIDETLTVNILFEYEKLVKMIAMRKIPGKVELSQICEAYELDRGSMEAQTHRIIKKHSKK